MQTLPLTFRQADLSDAESILGINLRSIFELCAPTYDLDMLRQWVGNRTASYFTNSIAQGQIYVAELGCGPVGFVDVVKGEVRSIYVLPGYDRHGVGGFLLAEAVRLASAGDHPVTVTASLNAVPFYKQFGFRSVKETRCDRNGVDLPLVQMELQSAAVCAR